MLGNFLRAVALILDQLLQIYSFVVLVSVLLSWVHPDPSNPIVRFLRSATEPVFDWVRRRLPFTMVGMMDLSPIAVFVVLELALIVVIQPLHDLDNKLQALRDPENVTLNKLKEAVFWAIKQCDTWDQFS